MPEKTRSRLVALADLLALRCGIGRSPAAAALRILEDGLWHPLHLVCQAARPSFDPSRSWRRGRTSPHLGVGDFQRRRSPDADKPAGQVPAKDVFARLSKMEPGEGECYLTYRLRKAASRWRPERGECINRNKRRERRFSTLRRIDRSPEGEPNLPKHSLQPVFPLTISLFRSPRWTSTVGSPPAPSRCPYHALARWRSPGCSVKSIPVFRVPSRRCQDAKFLGENASKSKVSFELLHVRNSERLQLIIRLGRPPLENSYGSGPLGSMTVAQKLRARRTSLAHIIHELEVLPDRGRLSLHDSRIRSVIAEIFHSCPEFDKPWRFPTPGGVVWGNTDRGVSVGCRLGLACCGKTESQKRFLRRVSRRGAFGSTR